MVVYCQKSVQGGKSKLRNEKNCCKKKKKQMKIKEERMELICYESSEGKKVNGAMLHLYKEKKENG